MPLLYKLFATMLHKRLAPKLDAQLTPEQAGFRTDFSTLDHLHTLTQLQEKTSEWQLPLWSCFIDFQKAFDCIEHDAIWSALSKQGIEKEYIELLKRLYSDQSGQVSAVSVLSRAFPLQRGTKQGDPLSTLLFNAVLEDIFRDVRAKWKLKRYGLDMSVGIERFLTSLSFADDVLLVAASAKQLKVMVADLMRAAAARGLERHIGKTKILTNASVTTTGHVPSSLQIDGREFAVLGLDDSTKYLGRKVCYEDPHGCEFNNRVAAAWGAFSKHKQELTDRRHKLRDRLRLFDAVVTSTLLYGCESWTLRVDQQRRLKTVQRKMVRMILNAKRRVLADSTSSETGSSNGVEEDGSSADLEPWQEFLERTAHWADEQLDNAGVNQWVTQWRRRKWKWAAKLMDVGNHKWSAAATTWQPLLHSSTPCGRRQARPRKRWSQDFEEYLAHAMPHENAQWYEIAKDGTRWLAMGDDFAMFE